MTTSELSGGRRRRLGGVLTAIIAAAASACPAAIAEAKPVTSAESSAAGEAEAAVPILGFNEDAVAGVHGVPPDQYVGLVRAIGGNVIRTNLDWRHAEPRQDEWDERWWAHWSELYDAALRRGVRPIFIIGFAPPWARAAGQPCGTDGLGRRRGPGFGTCELPPRRAMDVEWAEYAAEVARRFPEAMVEVWNEPNTADYWRPRPDPVRYTELLTLAYHAIKAVSPRTEVISGGLLNVRRTSANKQRVAAEEFLAVAYGASPSLIGNADYVGLHPYPSRAAVGRKSRFLRAIKAVRSVKRAAGDSRPILVTETGVSRADLAVAPQRRQAQAMIRIQRRLSAMPDVAGTVYHRIIEPKDTTKNRREYGYAWLRYGGSPLEPRQVYCRFVEHAGRSYRGC